MGRTPFRAAPRSTFVAAFAVLVVLNAAGWVRYGRNSSPALASARSSWAAGGSTHRSAPGDRPFVTLAAALPTRNVGQTDRLIVALAGLPESATPDAPGMSDPAPLVDAPFHIEPPLEGTWEWEGAGRLAFLLEEPLGECREVLMRPTEALERLLGQAVDPDFEAHWASSPLEVLGMEVTDVTATGVTARLRLNARLDSAEGLAALDVRLPGSNSPLDLTAVGTTAQPPVLRPGGRQGRRDFPIGFRFPRPAGDATHVEVRFHHPLQRARDEDPMLLEVPRRFALLSHDARIASDRNSAEIRLEFNASLDPTANTPAVQVRPAVAELSVRPSGKRLILEGAFEAGTRYGLTVPENLLASNGETLKGARSLEVRIPRRQPSLRIPAWRGTLSPEGNLTLELKATSVSAVRVTARKVLPGNLVEHVRGESQRHTSAEVLARTYALPESTHGGPSESHALDLRGLLERDGEPLPGVYHVEVSSTESRWTRDHATVRISDLGTTAKRDGKGLHLWVNSIATGAPIVGATVTALTVQDQLIGQAITDARGHAFIEAPQDRSQHGAARSETEPFLALVETATDMAYLELSSSTWDVPREVASGRSVPASADVFGYTERNLYRPGDPVYLTGIARSRTGVVHARPIEVTLTRPDGAVMHQEVATPDPGQGLFHLAYQTPPNARTGTWRFSFHDPDSGELVGSVAFGVEAFLPARMRLSSTSAPSAPMTPPTSEVVAASLAGTSTEGFQAELNTRFTPLTYRSKRFPLFTFELEHDDRHARRESTTATLDSEGRARAELPGHQDLEPGLWRASSTWTVTEPGSRSAIASSAIQMDTATEHRGLRIDGRAGVVKTGEPFQVLGLSVAPGDTPLEPRDLHVTLDRIERGYELVSDGGSLRWLRKVSTTAVSSHALDGRVGDALAADLTCPEDGEYRLTLRKRGEAATTVLRFHASEDPGRFQPPSPNESVTLTPETRAASPGSTVRVSIRSPFDGSALVTAEDDHLRWQQRVPVTNGRGEVEVPIPGDVRGGLVLSAQVSRPLHAQAQTWRPHRAYGFTRIETIRAPHELAVALEAPVRARPGELATVTVEAPASGRATVHLWAVDEGLRLAGGHRTPSPVDHFLGARAFHGTTTDTWSTLLPDLELPGAISTIGGDSGLAREARRRAPEEVHAVPAIVWNEAVLLGEDGRTTQTLRVPDFTGELTWMAVVVDEDRYGSSDAGTTVAGEIPITLGLPRFAAPGDQLRVKVAFENTMATSATVRPHLEIQGAAEVLEAPDDEPIELASGARHVAWFTLEATRPGRIHGTAWLEGFFADGREVVERAAIDLPVRHGRPFVTSSSSFSFDAGETHTVSLDLLDQLGIERSEREDCELRVSASAGLELHGAGAYLTEYPHGCAEQTASRIFAALSLHALRAKGDDEAVALAETTDRVTRGFLKLASYQVADGGIGYWPGDASSSAWASLHVADVIAAARELGFEVPARLVDRLGGFLDAQLRDASDRTERARLVHAAAALGSRHPGWIRRLEELPELLGRSGRAALAAALQIEGEDPRALAMLDFEPAPGAPAMQESGPFRYLDSRVRTAALELRVLLAIDPHHPGVAERVSLLEAERKKTGGRWRNTIDNAAALAALARHAQVFEANEASWDLVARFDGGEAAAVEASSASPSTITVPPGADSLDLDIEGHGPVFATLRANGRRSPAAAGEDRGLVCHRRLFDRSGEEIESCRVGHGDLVFVELTLATDGRSSVEDVAIVDPLPGGLEIETPKLIADFPWETDRLPGSRVAQRVTRGFPDRVEFLDDRVLIYGTAEAEPRAFRYAARAVALGTFEHGPVQAEAMYEPEVASVGGSTVRIEIVP